VDDAPVETRAGSSRASSAHEACPDDGGLASPSRERLYRLAYRFLWDPHDADDAVQDALAQAERSRGQLKDSRKRWAWLVQIVIQRCLLHRRKQAARRRHVPGIVAAQAARQADDPPAAPAETQELAQIVRALMDELPPRQRTALVLRHLENMDYRTIAQVMEVAESTARVHARDARESLRRMMLDRCPEWTGTDDG